MAWRINRHGIQTRVLVLQGAGWVTLLLLVAATAWAGAKQSRANAEERQRQLVTLVARQIDKAIADDLARVQELSGSPRLSMHDDDLSLERAAIFEAFHQSHSVESIRLVDLDGNTVVEHPPAFEPAAVDDTGVSRAISTGRLVSSARDPAAAQADVYVPLRNRNGDVEAVGVVAVTQHSRTITSLLETTGAQLLARDDRSADTVHAALTLVPWTVALRDTSGGLERLAWSTLPWMLVATLVVGAVFAWGTANSVRRPVLTLTAAAERMLHGDLDTPLPSLPHDEIGHLGRVLEHLRSELRGSLWKGETLRKVIAAQEDERRRIARELHDDICQSLAALGIGLDLAIEHIPAGPERERLDHVKAAVTRSLGDLHRVIYDLRPSVLDDLGLLAAVQWLASELNRRANVHVRFEVSGLEQRLAPEIETALFRVVQEALANVERHAEAESVLLQLSIEGSVLTIEVEDDGRGFDVAAVLGSGQDGRGLGLMGMRERVELLGGTLVVNSTPGAGSRLLVKVPIVADREKGDA